MTIIRDFPLYDARTEHDACGVGFIVNVNSERSHSIIPQGIEILVNLTHRGACGCDPEMKDEAGTTAQIPHLFCAPHRRVPCGNIKSPVLRQAQRMQNASESE
jgi:glutamate synthase domain-containing protein 1